MSKVPGFALVSYAVTRRHGKQYIGWVQALFLAVNHYLYGRLFLEALLL
jgi:hypothetical protein